MPLQTSDGRLMECFPYEDDYTVIGTTDEPWNGRPEDVAISDAEIEYMMREVNHFFKSPAMRHRREILLILPWRQKPLLKPACLPCIKWTKYAEIATEAQQDRVPLGTPCHDSLCCRRYGPEDCESLRRSAEVSMLG